MRTNLLLRGSIFVAVFFGLFSQQVWAFGSDVVARALVQVRFGGTEAAQVQLNAGPSVQWKSEFRDRDFLSAVAPVAALNWSKGAGSVSLGGFKVAQFGILDAGASGTRRSVVDSVKGASQMTGGEIAAVVVVSAFALTGAIALLAHHDLNSAPSQGQKPPSN